MESKGRTFQPIQSRITLIKAKPPCQTHSSKVKTAQFFQQIPFQKLRPGISNFSEIPLPKVRPGILIFKEISLAKVQQLLQFSNKSLFQSCGWVSQI
jgi:hypothetical protein